MKPMQQPTRFDRACAWFTLLGGLYFVGRAVASVVFNI
jgi:hypothetical protein